MTTPSNTIPRITGLLIIEVRNSNPNGDPDRESDPRTRSHDGRGIISDVSFKRKLRELILQKDGPVWSHMQKQMSLSNDKFGIHVDQETRNSEQSKKDLTIKKDLTTKFWDVRVFGSTSLEKKDNFIRTGVVQFGLGISAAKVRIERETNTVKVNVDAERDISCGMAPLAFRVVEHGVYSMPFLINPSAACKSGCQMEDLELLCRLIPYVYNHTASRIRPFVEIRHAWIFEHTSILGSTSDFSIIDELTPSKENEENPSTCWNDYHYDSKQKEEAFRKKFEGKFKHFGDLCENNEDIIKKIFN